MIDIVTQLALVGPIALAGLLMLPMLATRLQLGELLAADTTTLAPAVTANKIALIIGPFSLTETLVATDLTLASGGGLAPLAGATGAQSVAVDPTTLDQVIQVKPPAGGYRWVTSGGGPYPVVVYGYALLDSTLATLIAAAALPTPVSFSADGQFIEIDPVELTFVAQPVS